MAYTTSYVITLGQRDINSEWDYIRAVPSYHYKELSSIGLEACVGKTAYDVIIEWITIGY